MRAEREVGCRGCGMAAVPSRWDLGVNEAGDELQLCPVCGTSRKRPVRRVRS